LTTCISKENIETKISHKSKHHGDNLNVLKVRSDLIKENVFRRSFDKKNHEK